MEIAWIEQYIIQDMPASLKTFPEIMEYIAAQWEVLKDDIPPEEKGIYLATSDAGTSPSVSFWEEALKTGPGFASPGLFPWTLAGVCASFLALALNIKGPNITLIGDWQAVYAILEHALWDLETKRIKKAMVIGLDFLEDMKLNPHCSLLILSPNPTPNGLNICFDPTQKLSLNPSSFIKLICNTFGGVQRR